jgi:hypothetical protein
MPAGSAAKKKITERRRSQNKQAQKNYRRLTQNGRSGSLQILDLDFTGERQKNRLQTLEDLVGSKNEFESLANYGQLYEPGLGTCATSSLLLDAVCQETSTFHGQFDAQPRFGGTEMLSNPAGPLNDSYPSVDPRFQSSFPMTTPSTARVDIAATLNQHSGNESGERQKRGNLYFNAQQSTNPAAFVPPGSLQDSDVIDQLLGEDGIWDEKLKSRIIEKRLTLRDILKSGLKALAHADQSDAVIVTANPDEGEHGDRNPILRTDKILRLQNMNNDSTRSLPDLHRNNIRIKQFLFVAALSANAESLGLSLDILTRDDAESPFFRTSISEEVAKTSSMSDFSDLKTYLRPCASQVIHSHHPYIDVLPFPTLRERVIKLTCAEPPMIDVDELCNDLLNDGLICWGSSLGDRNSATGSGSPWDLRSWEAQPWFLRKWWIVLGGADGEIYQQTQWWCEMRGDRSVYPW